MQQMVLTSVDRNAHIPINAKTRREKQAYQLICLFLIYSSCTSLIKARKSSISSLNGLFILFSLLIMIRLFGTFLPACCIVLNLIIVRKHIN
jgi:hypothetical protein